jgi:hypothetical protein
MANLQDIVIGKNFAIQLNDGLGNLIQINRLKSFEPRPKVKVLESQDFVGINRHKNIYQGYEGDLEFEQIDDTLDAYFSLDQALYLNGSPQLYNTITETITYATGLIAQYMYAYAILTPSEFGSRRADDYVMQKCKFSCATRTKINF